jgi:hypothetical protein
VPDLYCRDLIVSTVPSQIEVVVAEPEHRMGVRCEESIERVRPRIVHGGAAVSDRQPLNRLPQRVQVHTCPHPECSRTVPSMMWACSEHWQALPPRIRQSIWAAFRLHGAGSFPLDRAEQHAFAYWGALERDFRPVGAEAPHTIA